MSHTTTLRGIQIKDANAIRQAVADLQNEGVKVELLENATPRMYYREQETQAGKCAFVLRLPGSRYDVGLKWNEKEQQYDAIMDIHGGDIRGSLGASCPLPVNEYGRAGEHAIGRFTQRYGINAAKRLAAQQGYMTTEITAEDGTVHLEVTGF